MSNKEGAVYFPQVDVFNTFQMLGGYRDFSLCRILHVVLLQSTDFINAVCAFPYANSCKIYNMECAWYLSRLDFCLQIVMENVHAIFPKEMFYLFQTQSKDGIFYACFFIYLLKCKVYLLFS